MGNSEDEKAALDFARSLQPRIDEICKGLAAGQTVEELKLPASKRHVHGLIADIVCMMQDGPLKRLDALERRLGVVRNPQKVQRETVNVLEHDASGRIARFEKLSGPQEEIDLVARIEQIERRLADGGYKGIWAKDTAYTASCMVTHSGSVWFAKADSVGVQPGENASGVWVLAVKRGRDGKDANIKAQSVVLK